MTTQEVPNWTSIQLDVLCSRCGYNLRSLEKPRCPECGLVFRWDEVIGAARDRQTDLFEYQFQKRPFGSWYSTMRGSFRPSRFWSGVSIHDTITVRPLWIHLASAVFLFYFGAILSSQILGGAAGIILKSHRVFGIESDSALIILDSLRFYGRGYIYLFRYNLDYVSIFGLSLLVNVLAPLLVLNCLHRTRAVHRIRPAQVLRTFAYAAPPSFFIAGVVNETAILVALSLGYEQVEFPMIHGIVIPAVSSAAPILFLRSALKHYLRIERPLLVALLPSIIGLLLGAMIQIFGF